MSFMTNRPVRGQDFFGRQSILKEIQKRVGRPTWVLGNRRVGKSSLLRQIEWLCDQKHWAGIHALYWDFQGAGSSEGLKESLLECLESKSQILDAFDLDIDDLEKYSFPELLTKIRRRFKGKGQFVFLIDEVEELVDISQREPQTLGALRKIQEPGSLSLIITGSRRLMELDESGALTSPLLPDFLPPLLLGPFQETETQQMLAAGKIPQETAHQIHQLTFGNPHLTNHLAERYLQLGSLDLATKSIMQDKVLNYFFQSNFSCLPHRYMEAWRSRKSTDLLQSIVPAHRDFPYLQQSVLIRAISESSVEVNPLLQLEEAGEAPITINLDVSEPKPERDILDQFQQLIQFLNSHDHALVCLPTKVSEDFSNLTAWESPPHLNILYSSGEKPEKLLELLQWSAPEYVLGLPANEATSTYLSALWLYRILMRQPLFETADVWALAQQLCEQNPDTTRFQGRPEMPPALAMVLSQALAPDPTLRHPSLENFQRDVLAVLQTHTAQA